MSILYRHKHSTHNVTCPEMFALEQLHIYDCWIRPFQGTEPTVHI